ncbi:ClpP/crotonase-like domain-containing protein [Fennellomyces sp. T-0311]|nr:ClpP/crotonase-like domain-containing protein [Fennellomyces sp. T-0311]
MTANFQNQSAVAAQRVLALQKQMVPSQAETIAKQHESGLCELQLNRPKSLNAVNYRMCDIIVSHLLAWEKSDKCKMITIKGNGGKAFCAGGDIKEAYRRGVQYRLHLMIGTLNKPYVALIDGITMGGGVGISMNAPFRVATEKTVFAMPENSIGLFSDASASFWMPRLDGKIGPYLGLTGQRLRGADVFYAGIATHYVPSKNLNELQACLDALAAKSNGTVDPAAINEVIESFAANMDDEKPFSLGGNIREAINRCFKYDTIEEIVDAVNNETVAAKWAKETSQQLSGMSPTSLKISLQLFHEGARRSLTDCMRLEYQLAVKVVPGPEFAEGTRATLITRSKPNWNPSTLQQVDTNEIKRYYFDTPVDSALIPLNDGGNYTEYRHRRFMLPTCAEITETAQKLGRENTIKYFVEKYNGKQGVKAKVADVLHL